MIPTEDEAKDLIARGLWKNLLMMLIEEVITMIQAGEENLGPILLIDGMQKQVEKLKEYLAMLGMYECFVTAMHPRTCIFRRDMIYETLYNEAVEKTPG